MEPAAKHGTILLVDDEKVLLDVGKDMLHDFGYRTITAGSGESALAIYLKEGETIDVVILDLCMPGMGGHKCLEELKKIDPDVKIVVASGSGCDADMTEALRCGAARYIFKPYRTQKILSIIESVMQRV